MTFDDAIALLSTSEPLTKQSIQKTYIVAVNKAEDAIDDARTAAEEDAAWAHLKALQQARATLLKTIEDKAPKEAAAAEQSTAEPQLEATNPTLAANERMDAEQARELLKVTVNASADDVQAAYSARMRNLERVLNHSAEGDNTQALWDEHSQVQQAYHFLLSHQPIPEQAQPLSKKQTRAMALIGIQGELTQASLHKHYAQKMNALEHQMDEAVYAEDVDQLSEQERQLQRAFGILNTYLQANASPSKHADSPQSTAADINKPRTPILKPAIGMLILLSLIIGGWLFMPAPALPEQTAAAQSLQRVQTIKSQIDERYQGILERTRKAGLEDSDDYPALVKQRLAAERLMSRKQVAHATQLLRSAEQAFKAGNYTQADELLKKAEPMMQSINTQLTPEK